MDELTEADELPALELLPSEIVCPMCNVTYNRALPECPDTYIHRRYPLRLVTS